MKNFLSWLRRNGVAIGVATAVAATISPSMREAAIAINAGLSTLSTTQGDRLTPVNEKPKGDEGASVDR